MNSDNRFYVRAYGCQMNQYEAGLVREILGRDGYTEVACETDADVILLLTCSVRKHAEQRAIGRLASLRGRKRSRPDLVLAVLGCTAQLRARELSDGLGADIVVGPDDYRRLPELIEAYREQRTPQVAAQLTGECYEGIIPLADGPVTGMVGVMRGCNNYCAYCIVPYVRGAERSKSRAAILAEVEHRLTQGVRDITLVGQNVLAYRDGDLDFVGLLQLVDRKVRDEALRPSHFVGARVRFLTSHPKDVTPELAAAMRDLKSVCPHLHIPLQSGSNRVLALMNRRHTREEYLARVNLLRRAVPDVSLTTDVLVGFPSESDQDFEQTMEIVEQVRFDFAYMFRYSERPGTRAALMEPKVPDEAARRRLSRLIAVQNRITREQKELMVGRRFEVLVEARNGPDLLARTRTNKTVAVKQQVPIGALLTVEVTGIQGWTPVARGVTHDA